MTDVPGERADVMNWTSTRGISIAMAVVTIASCGGDGNDEAWRDYYMPEWASGTEILPTQILTTPPPTVEIDPELAPGPEGPVAVEPIEDVPDLRENAPLTVQRGESLKLYAKWSGHSVDELMTMMDLSTRRITAGKQLTVSFSPSTWKRFQRQRQSFRQEKETAFFARNHVEDLVPYLVQKGDSVWKIANRNGSLPLWVLEKFNSRVDLAKLRPGMELLIPKLVPLGDNNKSPSQALWKEGTRPSTDSIAKRKRRPTKRMRRTARVATPVPQVNEQFEEGVIDEELSGMSVRVRDGETLRLYARWAGCLVREIRVANPGVKGHLRTGQSIFIPMAESRTTSFLRKRNDHVNLMEKETHGLTDVASEKARPATVQYAVKRGDTAWKIAHSHKLSLEELRAANRSINLARLRVGDTLKLPKLRE